MIHDEARSKLAADTKQSYLGAEVTAVVEVDRKNLDSMLAAELEVVRDNARYQADWAGLGLANDTVPMGNTVLLAMKEIKHLGVSTTAGLRTIRQQRIDRDTAKSKLANSEKLLAAWNILIPDCDISISASPLFPKNLDDASKKDLQSDYDGFVKECKATLYPAEKMHGEGKLVEANNQWFDAQIDLEKAITKQAAAKAEVATAKLSYDNEVRKAGDPTNKDKDLSTEIANKAMKLAIMVEDAKKLGKGLEHEPYIDALVDLLTATAGGNVDPKDPTLKGAIAVAKQIPSLVDDIDALETRRAAPPVAGLLIALRHQALLAEMAKQRMALAKERVAILKEKRDLYLQAVDRWLNFFDATCNYAVLGVGRIPPGENCDQFSVELVKTDPVGTVNCRYMGVKLEKCVLEQTWKDRFRANEKPEIRRQLYATVAAYLQAITLQLRPLEQSYKEIDVRHRETLLSKKTAIDQWDNLVSVPLDQLDAYYKVGVKPAELADLIVKALGFSAVAIGVSK
ncbi:MAG: hypothetical protein Q8S20_05575 [Sulfuritalea sp.]|nr:hypothetical protein [Sulfuritalea sp.]